jgi:hypothetical protein
LLELIVFGAIIHKDILNDDFVNEFMEIKNWLNGFNFSQILRTNPKVQIRFESGGSYMRKEYQLQAQMTEEAGPF